MANDRFIRQQTKGKERKEERVLWDLLGGNLRFENETKVATCFVCCLCVAATAACNDFIINAFMD